MRDLGAVLGMAALTVVVAGCAGQTAAPASASAVAQTVVQAAHQSAPGAISPVHLIRPAAPLRSPQAAGFVVMSPAANSLLQLAIVDASGRVVAKTLIPSAAEWLTAAGPGSAYWLDAGNVHALAADGSVRTLDAVPSDAQGLLVAPDGTSFAYTLSRPLVAGSMTLENSIVVQRFGGTARTIARRSSDPGHPSSDAPQMWTYMLLSWTNQGILFTRDAYGGCGCAPFDMEMQAGNAALIDPVSGGTTDITNDATCPLSGLGPSQTTACFHGGANADALRLARGGQVSATFAMSGQNAAGGAVFSPDAARLAYVTEHETSSDGCGGTWASTLHILSLDGSGTSAAAIDHFSTLRWTTAGLYGSIDGADAWSLVGVDPASMSPHTVWSGPAGSHFIGLA
ncbi:MAG: hypothetical protein JOZ46_05680 [Candidatus Dormibacteraeota bacterium]|nr:hypothetical protein [Candidatus Dormibacteraeota bacterium]MBV9525288.1 hypothetical protein [Candidatus Dormibacteraeota bacterium]